MSLSEQDRAKYTLPAKPVKPRTVVEQADEVVDIRDILKQMGLWAPNGDYYSYKIYCPWHFEHADQSDKNCRVFGGTNIYCFAGHGYISPTYLYARWKGIPKERAAEQLLDARGLLHKPWRQRWNDLVEEREEKRFQKLGSKQDLIAALHTELATYPEYIHNEYAPKVRETWQNVLKTIDAAWERNINISTLLDLYDAILSALLRDARMVDSSSQVTMKLD